MNRSLHVIASNAACRQDKRQAKQEGRAKARDIKY
jgi:hypothetical protein